MIEDIEAITEKIRKYVKKSVGQSRYEHSLRTAETCRNRHPLLPTLARIPILPCKRAV